MWTGFNWFRIQTTVREMMIMMMIQVSRHWYVMRLREMMPKAGRAWNWSHTLLCVMWSLDIGCSLICTLIRNYLCWAVFSCRLCCRSARCRRQQQNCVVHYQLWGAAEVFELCTCCWEGLESVWICSNEARM